MLLLRVLLKLLRSITTTKKPISNHFLFMPSLALHLVHKAPYSMNSISLHMKMQVEEMRRFSWMAQYETRTFFRITKKRESLNTFIYIGVTRSIDCFPISINGIGCK